MEHLVNDSNFVKNQFEKLVETILLYILTHNIQFTQSAFNEKHFNKDGELFTSLDEYKKEVIQNFIECYNDMLLIIKNDRHEHYISESEMLEWYIESMMIDFFNCMEIIRSVHLNDQIKIENYIKDTIQLCYYSK